jgi:predicted PurR-regulated permease PerM
MEHNGPPGGGGEQGGRTAGEPSPGGAFEPWSRPFLRHATVWLVVGIASGLVLAGVADAVLHRLAGFLQIIVISLFLSFAIEPAVAYLARRGWRRGAATGVVFLGVFLAVAGLTALMIPALVSGTEQLISSLPGLVRNLARFLRPLGIQFDQGSIEDQLRRYSSQLLRGAGTLVGGLLAVASGIVGAAFQMLSIALFTFYMVARGPQMRRAICSRFRPDRQRRILFIWEQAIGQTGGYFYSRLLLAVINGGLMYVVLRWRGVPFAAPLAMFTGVVSEFIPVVGTYIGGALPVLVALLYEPIDALWVFIWILVYQQIENYFLSPRLTARTMDLSVPVAFAAVLIGGALGGILFAFLALPAAGVILAAINTYGRYYEVVEDDSTVVPALAPGKPAPRTRWPRWLRWLRWLWRRR